MKKNKAFMYAICGHLEEWLSLDMVVYDKYLGIIVGKPTYTQKERNAIRYFINEEFLVPLFEKGV